MNISPITSNAVAQVLRCICPPAALSLPIHYISLPLRQRHLFLTISPHQPAEYLTWPPSHSDSLSVLHLLDLIRPEDIPDLLQKNKIHYLADPEDVYAHIRITPVPTLDLHSPNHLRLIFLWDNSSSSWKYHNSAIGDFPKNSHPDLSHAMALFHSPHDFLPEPTYSLTVDNLNDDDDAYWGSYATTDQLPQSLPPKLASDVDPEDAYWAQYSSIQGSADSTIPSPRPHSRLQHAQEDEQRIFVPSTDLHPDLLHSDIYNPLAPPTPGTLSRRLASLPTRPDSPPLHEPDDDPSDDSPLSPQSHLPDLTEPEEPFVILPAIPHPDNTPPAQSSLVDESLKNTIRGLYQLWRSRQQSQQDFITLVQQAIQEQS